MPSSVEEAILDPEGGKRVDLRGENSVKRQIHIFQKKVPTAENTHLDQAFSTAIVEANGGRRRGGRSLKEGKCKRMKEGPHLQPSGKTGV